MLRILKNYGQNPVFQAACILLLMLVFMVVSKVLLKSSLIISNPTFSWEIMAALILFFALVNCVFSLQSINQLIYWRNSIFSFAALLFLGGFMAYLFSRTSIFDAGSISWILFIFSFSYLIFLSIVNLMRFIVDLAQKQDARLRGEDDFKPNS